MNNQLKIHKLTLNKVSYVLQNIKQKDILDRVIVLSLHKSSGMKDNNTVLIKTAMTTLTVELMHLYNMIIDTDIFPEHWKLVTVTPIPKIRNPKYCIELRPISIL